MNTLKLKIQTAWMPKDRIPELFTQSVVQTKRGTINIADLESDEIGIQLSDDIYDEIGRGYLVGMDGLRNDLIYFFIGTTPHFITLASEFTHDENSFAGLLADYIRNTNSGLLLYTGQFSKQYVRELDILFKGLYEGLTFDTIYDLVGL